jgi:hypothetical protein
VDRAARLLATAASSLEAAGRRDRAGWLTLFTDDGQVEDPVGSRPHIGHPQIGRFFDTFIAPRQISFDLRDDFVGGSTVVRDLTLNVRMGPSVSMQIPAILGYEIAQTDAELKVSRLQAYWELPPMILQFARNGLAAAPAGVGLVRAMLANQGPAGALGFIQGFRRIGGRARGMLQDLFMALKTGDELTVRRLLSRSEVVSAELPVLAEKLPGAHSGKVITAGTSVAVSLYAGAEHRGVVIADFAGGPVIRRLRFFG